MAFLIFLGANLISWSSTKQYTVARSSTEAKYHVIAVAVAKMQWVKSLLSELLVPVLLPPTLFSNNVGATYLSCEGPELGVPVDHRQAAETCVSHIMRPIRE